MSGRGHHLMEAELEDFMLAMLDPRTAAGLSADKLAILAGPRAK